MAALIGAKIFCCAECRWLINSMYIIFRVWEINEQIEQTLICFVILYMYGLKGVHGIDLFLLPHTHTLCVYVYVYMSVRLISFAMLSTHISNLLLIVNSAEICATLCENLCTQLTCTVISSIGS